jgi:hypothetical protein
MKIQNAHEVVIFLKAESNKFHALHLATRKVVNKYFWRLEKVTLIEHGLLNVQQPKGVAKFIKCRMSIVKTQPRCNINI